MTIDENNETNLSRNSTALQSLKTAGKWSRFLAIIGFVSIAFLVIFGLFFGTFMNAFMSNMPTNTQGAENLSAIPFAFMGIIYIVMALVMFFPVYYQFNFGRKITLAIKHHDEVTLTDALNNLGKHYQYIGILTAIFLGLYTLIFLSTLLGALVGGSGF